MRCAVCSSEVDSEARLVRCEGCIWRDQVAASHARERLSALRKCAGDYAYAPDGCSVCKSCRAHFAANAGLCPLVFFYNAPRPDPREDSDGTPERFVAEVEECWDSYLHEHGYPEHVEAYWRRLTQCVYEPTRG